MIKIADCKLSRLLFLFAWLGYFNPSIQAQPCQCINCPGQIPKAGNKECSTTEFLYFVNGASSNELADAFQGVCAVNLAFKADNIFQIEMYLISPGGDTVKLICPDAGPGVGVTALTTWNISFLPNSNAVFPDPGFSPVWTNYDPWETGANYFGSYHPCSGALEDFNSGPVNGPWKLLVKNFAPLNKGDLLDFSIVFCDETGIECGCLAYAGIFPSFQVIDACQGSTKLLLDLKPNYNGYIPDTTMYNYTYAIASPNNTIIEFDTIPDLTAYPIGNYKVCGLSYLASDSSLIIKDAGFIKLDTIYNEINSSDPAYCADLSKNCIFVNINPPPNPETFNFFLCKDSCLFYEGTEYCTPGTYNFTKTDSLGCKQNITLNLTPSDAQYVTKLDTICSGEFAILGTDFYNKTGSYTKIFKSFTGCDSVVTLQLTVVDINLSVAFPDTINCINNEILLDATDFSGLGSLIKYNWAATNGGVISGNPSLLDVFAENSGTYTLTGKYIFQSGKTCSDFVSVEVVKSNIQPELSNVPDQFLCLGDKLDLSKLNIKEIHGYPGNITYHSSLPPSTLNVINPLLTPSVNSIYYAYFTAGNCDDVLPVNVFVNSSPKAELKDFVSVCNSSNSGNITDLKFDSLIISGDDTGFWVDSDMSGAGGTFPLLNFSGVSPGTYQFVYFTQSAIPPCSDTFYVVNVIVEDCECPSLAVLSPGNLCNNNADLNLNDFLITTEPGTWSIVNAPGGSTAVINTNIFSGNGSIPGMYTLRFTLNQQPPAGCPAFVDIDIEINALPVLSLVDQITVCNSDDKGASTILDLSSLIVTGDKSGIWTDLDGSGGVGFFPVLDFKGINPGIYKFQYETNNADYPCPEVSDTVLIIIEDCTCPLVDLLSETICNHTGSYNLANLNLSGQTGTWSINSPPPGSNPAIIIANNLIFNNSDAGVYGLNFKISNPVNGCPSDYSTTIKIIDKPYTQLDTVINICNSNKNGNNSILNFSGLLKSGDLGGSWQELIPAGATGTLPILDYNGVAPGNYFVKYTTASAISPCKESEYLIRVIVEDCECPSVATTSPGIICNDNPNIDLDNFKITSEPGSWAIIMLPPGNNPASINANVFSGTTVDPGKYTVQFILLNPPPPGCPVSSIQIIDVVAGPDAILTDSLVICNSNSSGQNTMLDLNTLILSGSSGGTWTDISGSGAQGTFPVIDFDGVVPGKYIFRYTLTATLPCQNKIFDVTIEVTDCQCPQILVTAIPDICNDEVLLDLNNYIAKGVNAAFLSVPVGQNISVLQNNIIQTNNILPGTYSMQLSLINTPPPGCPTDITVSFKVSDNKSSGSKVSDLKFCESQDTIFNLSDLLTGEDSGGFWSVQPGSAGLNSANNTLEINKMAAGSYILAYVQNNTAPCAIQETKINIEILSKPPANAGTDKSLDCSNSLIMLGDSGNSNLQNVSFLWQGGNLSGITSPNPETNLPGVYVLEVTSLITGCKNSDVVEVKGGNDIEITADYIVNQPGCKGSSNGSILVSVNQGNPPFLFSLNGAPFQNQSIFKNLVPGDYKVEIEDAAGCLSDTIITIYSPYTGGLSLGSDTTIIFGDSILLKPVYSFDKAEIDTIIWKTHGEMSCFDCLNPFVKPFKDTKYYLTINTISGCTYTAEIIITVKKDIKLFVPNVFSPDGDGVNDYLEIFPGPQIEKIKKFQIFDRWGELLFQQTEMPVHGQSVKTWDGKLKGKSMNSGVFVYYLTLEFIDGKFETITGEITTVK